MNKIIAGFAMFAVMLMSLVFANSAAATDGGDCTPQPAYTEYTGWVLESPGEGWYQVDERTVVDTPAHTETEVVTEAQHYSLKGNSGIGKDEVPLPPSQADYWQANTHKEPHLNNANITWIDGYGTGLHYASHGSKGNRDWFYFQPEVTQTVEVPAVTHQEYKFAFDHPATTCPPPSNDDVCLNLDGVQETVPDGYILTSDGNCLKPVLPTATAPDCDTDGVLIKPEQPEGIFASYTPEGTGPGIYTVHFSDMPDDGGLSYDFRDSYTIEVLAATGDCPTGHQPPETSSTQKTVKHPATPAVPTVVESGLATLDSAQPQSNDHTGLFVLLGIGILLLGVGAIRKTN